MSANATNESGGRQPVSPGAHTPDAVATTGMDRKAQAYLSASKHSLRVRVLKFLLPVLAAFFVGAFYYFSRSHEVTPDEIELSSGNVQNGKIVMANPVLKGFTKDNLPYRVTAERAVQAVGKPDLVDLENIRASIPVNPQSTATIGANSGAYDNAKRTLNVDSPLTVTTTDGMTAKLQSAFIEMKSGSLETKDPVEIEQEGSRITARSMKVEDHGRVMVFEKNVQLTITPDRLKSAPGTGQEGNNAN